MTANNIWAVVVDEGAVVDLTSVASLIPTRMSRPGTRASIAAGEHWRSVYTDEARKALRQLPSPESLTCKMKSA